MLFIKIVHICNDHFFVISRRIARKLPSGEQQRKIRSVSLGALLILKSFKWRPYGCYTIVITTRGEDACHQIKSLFSITERLLTWRQIELYMSHLFI